jgi:hypothetical protein
MCALELAIATLRTSVPSGLMTNGAALPVSAPVVLKPKGQPSRAKPD